MSEAPKTFEQLIEVSLAQVGADALSGIKAHLGNKYSGFKAKFSAEAAGEHALKMQFQEIIKRWSFWVGQNGGRDKYLSSLRNVLTFLRKVAGVELQEADLRDVIYATVKQRPVGTTPETKKIDLGFNRLRKLTDPVEREEVATKIATLAQADEDSLAHVKNHIAFIARNEPALLSTPELEPLSVFGKDAVLSNNQLAQVFQLVARLLLAEMKPQEEEDGANKKDSPSKRTVEPEVKIYARLKEMGLDRNTIEKIETFARDANIKAASTLIKNHLVGGHKKLATLLPNITDQEEEKRARSLLGAGPDDYIIRTAAIYMELMLDDFRSLGFENKLKEVMNYAQFQPLASALAPKDLVTTIRASSRLFDDETVANVITTKIKTVENACNFFAFMARLNTEINTKGELKSMP